MKKQTTTMTAEEPLVVGRRHNAARETEGIRPGTTVAFYERRSALYRFFRDKWLTPLNHYHDEIELIYICSGSAIVVIDGVEHEARAGEAIVVFPGQEHSYDSTEDGHYFVVLVSTSALIALKNTLDTHIPEKCIVTFENDHQSVDFIYKLDDGAKSMMSVTYMIGYLNLLFDRIIPRINLTPRRGIGSNAASSLARVVNFCRDNYAEDLTLDSVGEHVYLSRYYISHLLREQMNTTFGEFLTGLRIDAACKKLRDTNLKVEEIAHAVGFRSVRTFNRAFSQRMGVSPLVYRKRMRDENLIDFDEEDE